jgi:hypothetical protein
MKQLFKSVKEGKQNNSSCHQQSLVIGAITNENCG